MQLYEDNMCISVLYEVLDAVLAERSSKYQCPDDFVCFSHKPCSSTLTESLKSSESELWLIKAPANFDPLWSVTSLMFSLGYFPHTSCDKDTGNKLTYLPVDTSQLVPYGIMYDVWLL